MNRISNGKVGIQDIELHGSIRHNSPIQIQSLELSVKMYFSRSPSLLYPVLSISYKIRGISNSVHGHRYSDQVRFPASTGRSYR